MSIDLSFKYLNDVFHYFQTIVESECLCGSSVLVIEEEVVQSSGFQLGRWLQVVFWDSFSWSWIKCPKVNFSFVSNFPNKSFSKMDSRISSLSVTNFSSFSFPVECAKSTHRCKPRSEVTDKFKTLLSSIVNYKKD